MFDDDDDDGGARVDLTPLVDVIFMLVIFFIMTASFELPVLEMQLPSSSQPSRAQVTNRVTVVVDEQGQIRMGSASATEDDIASALSSARDPVLEVVIDKRAPSGILIDMADLARKEAGGRIIIAVQGEKASGTDSIAK